MGLLNGFLRSAGTPPVHSTGSKDWGEYCAASAAAAVRNGLSRAVFVILAVGVLLGCAAIDHGTRLSHASEISTAFAVATGNDDAVENAKTGFVTVNYKSTYPSMHYLIGYRFSNVNIPWGAAIRSAVLYQWCAGYETRKTVFTYRGEASRSPASFAKSRYNLSARNLTDAAVAGVTWPWEKRAFNPSPDLKSVVQEIVNLPGWTPGSPLCLVVDAVNTSSIDHYERLPSHSAILEIVYSDGLGAPSDTVPPQVTIADPAADCTVSQASVNFQGTATDNVEVSSVEWETDTGASGSAVGTNQWTVNAVPLQEGTNTFTVRAHDAIGNVAEATRVLVYQPSAPYSVLEGFGKDTTGGRGKTVYTARNASEFKSVLSAVKKRGGNAVINLEGSWSYTSDVSFSHMSNFTLNGTDASVVLDGASLYLLDCTNVVIQGIRVRKHQTGDDCIQLDSCERVWIDHCSVSEAGDGNLDITGYTYGPSRQITVSWCILANSWKQSLVKYNGTTDITFHHNLFYNGGGRFAHFNEGVFDFRNNVVWQWGSYATTLTAGAQANIVNNYYKIPSSSSRGGSAIWYTDTLSEAWIAGNVLPSQEKDVSRLSEPLSVPEVETQSAGSAKALVLDGSGAQPRDAYDEAIIDIVRSNAFPALPPYHD